jgi:hypothetical protein
VHHTSARGVETSFLVHCNNALTAIDLPVFTALHDGREIRQQLFTCSAAHSGLLVSAKAEVTATNDTYPMDSRAFQYVYS